MGALTPFIGILYSALEDANQEATGFIRAATKNMEASRVAKGQMVYAPVGKVSKPTEIVPGVNPGEVDMPDIDKVGITIEHESKVTITLTGNESLGLDSSGNYDIVTKANFTDALRQLNNEIEAYMAKKVVAGASRGFGDGSTPAFNDTDSLNDLAQLGLILDDNGCPQDGRNFVMNNTAFAALRAKSMLNNAYKLGSDEFIRYGYTDPVLGFRLWSSFGLKKRGASTGSGYQAGDDYEIGATELTLGTGSGTIQAGDGIKFGDTTYIVNNDLPAPGIITLGRPGLVAPVTNGTGGTLVHGYTPSVAFHTDAVHLATRAPAVPKMGDSAVDRFMLVSDKSGLVYEVSLYPQYKQVVMEIGIAYGASVMNSENVAVLLSK